MTNRIYFVIQKEIDMKKQKLKDRLQSAYLDNYYLKEDNEDLKSKVLKLSKLARKRSQKASELVQEVTFLKGLTENITVDDKADIARLLLENEKLRSDNKGFYQVNHGLLGRIQMYKDNLVPPPKPLDEVMVDENKYLKKKLEEATSRISDFEWGKSRGDFA